VGFAAPAFVAGLDDVAVVGEAVEQCSSLCGFDPRLLQQGACSIDPENSILGKPEPIDGLSDDERALLGEALCALRRKRGRAWNTACDAAEAQAKVPSRLVWKLAERRVSSGLIVGWLRRRGQRGWER